MAAKTYSMFEYLFEIEEHEDGGYLIEWNEEYFSTEPEETSEEEKSDWDEFWSTNQPDDPADLDEE